MSTALQTQPRPGSLVPSDLQYGMTRDQIDLIKRTIAKGVTDDELALFLSTAQRMKLDPFAKQIYAVKRYDKREQREVMSIQVSIDGYRVGAMRSDAMDGEDGPWWCGADGVWVDAWLHAEAPRAAKFAVYRKGCSRPFVGVASYDSYVQMKDGKPNSMWERGPDFMLAKCAEAVAKRRAFPLELHGTVTPDEIGDDAIDVEFRTVETATPVVQPRAPQPSKPAVPAAAVPAAPPANVERTEPAAAPPPVSAHSAERQAAEDKAREDALAKAKANAAELDESRRSAAAQQTAERDTTPAGSARAPIAPGAVLTEDDINNLAGDLYKAPHLGALKTIALAISKSKATPEQRAHLEKIFNACETTLKAKAAKSQGAA